MLNQKIKSGSGNSFHDTNHILKKHSDSINTIIIETLPFKSKSNNNKEKIRKYIKGRLLGKGGFAKCYELICQDNNKVFAAKMLPRSNITSDRQLQKLMTEIKIHKSLHHPQIVAFEHYFEDTENVYILLEICQNQTLNDLLKPRKRLAEIDVQCYIVQLIKS